MNKLGAFVVGIMVGGVVTVKFIGKGLVTASKGLAKGSAWIITPSNVKIDGEETMMSPLSVFANAGTKILEASKNDLERIRDMAKKLKKAGYTDEFVSGVLSTASGMTVTQDEVKRWAEEDEKEDSEDSSEAPEASTDDSITIE